MVPSRRGRRAGSLLPGLSKKERPSQEEPDLHRRASPLDRGRHRPDDAAEFDLTQRPPRSFTLGKKSLVVHS